MNPEKKLFKAAVINANQLLESQARDIGDAKMTESKEDRSSGRVKKFFTRLWKHNLAQEYYRQKEISKARKDILESGNLYKGEAEFTKDAVDLSVHKVAMDAIISRFTSEYEKDMLKEDELASKEKGSETINNKIKELIKTYAATGMSEDAFREAKNKLIFAYDPAYAKEKSIYIDNLLDIANEVKASLAHGEKLEMMDFDVELTLGKARESLNTEAKKSTFDKFMTSKIMTATPLGQSAALIGVTAGAYSLTKTLTVGAGRKAAKWFGFGAGLVAGGALEAAKEGSRLKRERAQHIRESAKGMKFEEDDMERRKEMEKNRYETKGATEMITNLEAGLATVKNGNFSKAELDAVLTNLADLEARIKLGDQKKIDLISYDGFEHVEKDRMMMDLKRAELKVALRKNLADKATEFTAGESVDAYIARLTAVESSVLLSGEAGIEAKDKVFTKLKRAKMAKAFARTVLIGGVVSFAVDEVKSLFTEEDGLAEGIVKSLKGHMPNGIKEHVGDLHHKTTSIEALRRWIMNDTPRMPTDHMHEVVLGATHMHLPDGVELEKNADGTFDIVRGDEVLSNDIPLVFGADGNLSQVSQDLLKQDDIYSNFAKSGKIWNDTDYVNNAKDMHHVIPDYMDNDSKEFDFNEQKLWWGGETDGTPIDPAHITDHHNTGLDTKGNFVFSTSHMTEGGSFHKNIHLDAPELQADKKLTVLLSVSQGTQDHVFEVPVDANGNAIIDKNSEMARLLFKTENGHAVFMGHYAQVAEVYATEDGVEKAHVLATHIGREAANLSDVTPNVTLDIPNGSDYEPPIPVPINPRRPLERGEYKKKGYEVVPPGIFYADKNPGAIIPLSYYFGGSGFESSEAQRAQYEKDRCETLKQDPEASLDQFKEIDAYLEKQDKEYVKELEAMAKEMGAMNAECRLSVCMPAAGHQEGDSIYQTLQNYSHQTVEKNQFEIVIFVNRPEKDKHGNVINPDKTLDEINRFKKDHPDMNIRVAERVLPIKDAKIGHIRKIMNDAVLLRQYNRGQDAQELFMVSNDADNKGLSPEYIKNFISKFDNNKDVDSLVGQLDWDPKSYIRNPLIHIGTRLFQFEGVQARQKGYHFNSSGANFAFRASMYAGVGGYSGNLGGGEDTDFGAKISAARQGAKLKKPIAYAGARASRLYTSSRRAEMVMKNYGLAPIEQWDKGFSAFDDEVRKVNWENNGEVIDYKDPATVKKLIKALETVINRTIDRTKAWNGSAEDATLKRSLRLLGVEYKVTGPHSIEITSATKLIKGLEQYQTEGLKTLEKKTSISKKETELKKAQTEEKAIFAEFEKFTNEHPDEKVPEELEARYKVAEDKLNKLLEK